MSIKAKILSLVLAFTLLAAAITALGLKTMVDYDKVIADYVHASNNAFSGERLNRYVLTVAIDLRGMFMAKNKTSADERALRLEASANRLEAFAKQWKTQLNATEMAEFRTFEKDLNTTIYAVRKLSLITRNESLQKADSIGNNDAYRRFRESMQVRIDNMITKIEARLTQSRAEMNHFKAERIKHFLLIATLGIALLIAGSIWIAVSAIASPLRRVSQSIVKISEGAYDTPIPTEEKSEEIAEVWGALAILKDRAMEADRLTREERVREQKLRELVLD
jgi:nitrate/nitrite-specific signal transduction histidine kinase